jgi:hypothetical protein
MNLQYSNRTNYFIRITVLQWWWAHPYLTLMIDKSMLIDPRFNYGSIFYQDYLSMDSELKNARYWLYSAGSVTTQSTAFKMMVFEPYNLFYVTYAMHEDLLFQNTYTMKVK